MTMRTFFLFGLSLLTAACGSGYKSVRTIAWSGPALAPATSLPEGPAVMESPEYRINLFDELEIRVEFHERLNNVVTVRPDGRISLVNIGDLYVFGLTPSELDSILTARYSEVVYEPEVTVMLRGFGGRVVYVLGEVDKPGVVEMQPGMTALQALAAAGGPIPGARLSSTIVIRPGPQGKPVGIQFNLERDAIENGQARDLRLLPRDIVYVPRTFIGDLNDFLGQFYSALLPPIDTYIRALREYGRR